MVKLLILQGFRFSTSRPGLLTVTLTFGHKNPDSLLKYKKDSDKIRKIKKLKYLFKFVKIFVII